MLVVAALNPSLSARSRHPTKSTRTSRNFVPNSPGHDDDENDTIEVATSTSTLKNRRVLKEVAIPVMGARKPQPTRGRPSASKAPSTESSNGSPSFDNSDYDTPGTSISTTPATSFRNGKTSVRKSGLSKALSMSLSRSSSLKRTRSSIVDSEDDDKSMLDADAELALQLQMDEDASHENKRRKIIDLIETSEEEPLISRPAPKRLSGKGKGKVQLKIEDSDIMDDSDSMPEELTSPPAYKGKGKGKAKASPASLGRAARSSAQKIRSFKEDDFVVDDSEEGEDFKPPEEEDSDLSDAPSHILLASASDSEEESLMSLTSRLKKSAKARIRAPKAKRGKKKKSAAEEAANQRRRERFAHIDDKWERKKAMNRERAEEQHPKLLSMWKDLEKVAVLETQMAEQPSSINRRLKPFQLEGLSWMIRQEKTHYRGGLLGDEMGMGKTIQAVSLIMSDYPAKEPTLVCVPPVALMQWSNEIREYTDNKLKVLVYHGTNAKCKKMSVKELRSYDVIMVSYNSLESLHRKETKGWSRGEDIIKEASPLHAIQYHRLILDEAHSIKSRNTGVAKACFALRGDYKWCLSGTPVQNRIGEFFSLLRFLEVRPFADYFCRSCDCEKLHWAVDEDHMCVACNHGASEHISVFNQELLNPITGDDPEVREDALSKLHMITARIMLRRMKRDHTNSMVSTLKIMI